MNRIDTKFIANADILCQLLEHAAENYFVQEADGQRLATYDTLYYDTTNLDMYIRHHDRQLCRQKIRTRTYVDSNISFLEVKNKTNKGRTKKKRIAIPDHTFWNIHDNTESENFLETHSRYQIAKLTPQVRTQFNRITLVNKEQTERLTIDLNLRFENIATKKSVELPQLMIIELKQDGMCHSRMKDILLSMRIKPTKISKYCIGTALTNPSIKQNRFKAKIRKIQKIGSCNLTPLTGFSENKDNQNITF